MQSSARTASTAGANRKVRGARPRIVVKFRDHVQLPYAKGAERALEAHQLGPWSKLANGIAGLTMEPLFMSVKPVRLRELVALASQRNPSYRAPNFFSFFAIPYVPGADLHAMVRELRSWPSVEDAYADPGPTPPPAVNAANDPRWPMQGYLDAGPTGINAEYGWLMAGGDGAGQSFVDLEYGWRLQHEDLADHDIEIISGENSDFVEFHGTAVLGVVCGVDNTVGGVGITPHLASVRVVSEQRSALTFSTSDDLEGGPEGAR